MVMLMVMMVMTADRADIVHIQQSGVGLAHDVKNLLAGELIPRGGDDARLACVLLDQCNRLVQAFLAELLRAAEYDGLRVFQLVVVELAKILDVHTALGGVRDGGQAA